MSTFKYELEERLIGFAATVMSISDQLPLSNLGAANLASHLVRCATAPALNYAAAQSATSPRDFLAKLKLCLKDLRETQIALRITLRKKFIDEPVVEPTLEECNHLIGLFSKSVKTKRNNMLNEKKARMEENLV
jgi:four helix bundle protein